MPPPTISEAIASAGDTLTPTEREIARAITGDPTLLAFATVSNLASAIGTSRPSVVRFATKLGYGGYPEMQAAARSGLTNRLSRPSERVRSDSSSAATDLATQIDSLVGVHALVEAGRLAEMALLIADAEAVWIVSGETSRAAANALASGLGTIRDRVRLVDDHTMGRTIADAGAADVAVVSDFARYRRTAVAATEALAAGGVPIIAITDGPLSPLAALATELLELPLPGIGPFDSSVPTVALAELIVAEVARLRHDEVAKHIDRTEAIWAATGAFAD